MKSIHLILCLFISSLLLGCSSQDIPPAHKGRMFDKTGPWAFYSGGHGFEGPVLNPGTYFTAMYPEVRMIACGQRTVKEGLIALTKDGVQFELDLYVRFAANCDDDNAVTKLLTVLSPSADNSATEPPENAKKGGQAEPEPVEPFPALTITSRQIYRTFIRPALGEAVREAVSSYIANEINGKRDEMFQHIKDRFQTSLNTSCGVKKDEKCNLVTVYALNLSNLNFPDQLEKANTDRATQAVLRDKSIAERENVQAEIETAKLKVIQSQTEAQAKAAEIDTVGAALHRNPEYYVRDIYYYAADKGGSIVLPGNPNVMLQMTPKKP